MNVVMDCVGEGLQEDEGEPVGEVGDAEEVCEPRDAACGCGELCTREGERTLGGASAAEGGHRCGCVRRVESSYRATESRHRG